MESQSVTGATKAVHAGQQMMMSGISDVIGGGSGGVKDGQWNLKEFMGKNG